MASGWCGLVGVVEGHEKLSIEQVFMDDSLLSVNDESVGRDKPQPMAAGWCDLVDVAEGPRKTLKSSKCSWTIAFFSSMTSFTGKEASASGVWLVWFGWCGQITREKTQGRAGVHGR